MTERRDKIIDELDRIRESVELTSVQHFIASRYWRRAHLVLGITATIAATITTALIFAAAKPMWAGILGVVVAIISGLITFLDPKHHAEEHHRKGVNYQEIGSECRMLSLIDGPYVDDEEDIVQKVKSLSKRKHDLDRIGPAAPAGLIYALAKRSIARGETRFRVDHP